MMRTSSLVFLTMMMGTAALGPLACSDDGSLEPVPGGSSGTSGGTSGTSGGTSGGVGGHEDLEGEITAPRTLTKDKTYLIKGIVRVKEGATLTIEKGTTIQGDNASKGILLIEPGAKIMAEGTADEPIVFTSQAAEGQKRPGQWGGIVILGKAPVNWPGGKGNVEGFISTEKGTTYGGTDANDSSGVLKYVRIEYSGVIIATGNEVNGLTLAGVGAGTQIDYVQVRYTLDDCFEFFGGTVNAKHLICAHNQDDGFDFDNGFTGKLQYIVLQQDPANPSDDNGIESDNDADNTGNEPLTNPQVFNATFCGKNADPAILQAGILTRRNARGIYKNFVFSGFEAGLDIRDERLTTGPQFDLTHSLFFNSKGAGVVDNIAYPETGTESPNKDNDKGFDEVAFIKEASRSNTWDVDPGITCFDRVNPVFGPATTIAGATPPSDGFFDASATYKGAFKDANDKWATTGNWAKWTAQ